MIAQSLRLAAAACVLSLNTISFAAPSLLWQIGQRDNNYSEFALARDYGKFQSAFGARPVIFEVGKSDPARDWPFIHPGPVDGWAGNREHPLAIRFSLSELPRGAFTLKVAFVDAQSAVPPALLVKVGSRTGRFQLKHGGGDASLTDPARGKPQEIVVAIPAAILAQGANEIVLTAIHGSWAEYDSVAMYHDPSADTANPVIESIEVNPAPLLKRDGSRLRRLVEVRARLSAPCSDVRIGFDCDGETRETSLPDLGGPEGYSTQLFVPATESTADLKVTVTAGANRQTISRQLAPPKRWKIFIASSAHTDIGYTDIQPKCAERHNDNTDTALDLLERYPDFKWNLEVAWQAENYLAARPEARRAQFQRFAKQGRLGVQALYCNTLTGIASYETACRFTRLAHQLNRRWGVPFESAMISDVPSQEASLPMLLAEAGIRYFSSGINNDRAYPFTYMQTQSPCWWEGPDGSRILMHYATMYAQASSWGLDSSVDAAATRILDHLKQYESRTNYPYDAVFLHGAFGDNSLLSTNLPEVVRSWNAQYESPKLIHSVNAEFFKHIEKHYGEKLPVFKGSAGTYWEDGAGSSAFETALCRSAKETLATVEKCFALAGVIQNGTEYPSVELDEAWRNAMLYDEHTWGAHCSISQPDSDFSKAQWKIKAQFALDASSQAKALLQRATTCFGKSIKTAGSSLIVMNPDNWARTDVIPIVLPEGMRPAGAQFVSTPNPGEILLLAKDVPACGYQVLKLEPGAAKTSETELSGNSIESSHYRVEFDPVTGAVTSFFDKALKRELADANAPYRLNQYLYVSGGEGSRIVMNPNGPEPKLEVGTSGRATLRRLSLGSLGERMIVSTSGPMASRLVTEVTVWNDLRRVDFANHLTKTQTYKKEAVYFAFPFAAAEPTVRYQIPAGIVNANTDMLPGACLDWFSVQHGVEVEAKDVAISWATPDAPLVCFQDINRGKWLRELPMKTGHLFSYAMNNYWHTNYKPGQGGEHEFRFSITSRPKTDNAQSARFGWEASNPLPAVVAAENNLGSLPGATTSLVQIDNPNVILLAAKKADDNDDVILRLWESSGMTGTTTLDLARFSPTGASACTLVEEIRSPLPLRNGKVTVSLRGFGLATVRLHR